MVHGEMGYNCQKVESLKLAAAESPISPLQGAKDLVDYLSTVPIWI